MKPEIAELLRLVEIRYTKPLSTTTDFEEFSLYLEHKHGLTISSSTLKRLWGYVNDQHQPRKNTLDKLAVYLDHQHFDDFCEWLKTSTRYNSSFFSTRHVDAKKLSEGQQVVIGWAPNRRLLLEYQGGGEFVVVDAQASKLLCGDRFPAPFIYKSVPLYLPWVERGGERLSPFVAGRNGGLTVVKMCK